MNELSGFKSTAFIRCFKADAMFDKLIVITDPEFFEGEAETLNQLFDSGLTRLHVRKPKSCREELQKLVLDIDPNFRRCITIHHHSDLLSEMGLGGMHFSYPDVLNQAGLVEKYTVSCSLHQWKELDEVGEKINYCFMSPVFNSISKIGYQANKNLLQVPAFAQNVFALGGITDANCEDVMDSGYSGVAALGYLWIDKAKAFERFNILREKLQAYGN
jgi:thiamine-phosphate pyrophosphorylase